MTTTPVLARKALNRATLARQLLLERAARPAGSAIAALVGLQAQQPSPPYVGLWSRLPEFTFDTLTALIVERSAVRAPMMRGTLHLVTADDFVALRPAVQPAVDRALAGFFGRQIAAVDRAALVVRARALVEEQPRTNAELGVELAPDWPDVDPAALAYAARCLLALVQVPPGGTWGSAGADAAYTTVQSWLGRPTDPHADTDALVLRYFAAFGPATVKDLQVWAGMARLAPVVDRLGRRLRRFRDEHGAQLFDLEDGALPDPDTPAPPRFLPEFDNLLVAHADRRRVIADKDRGRVCTSNGIVRPTLLVDGFIAGTWRVKRSASSTTLVIELFDLLRGDDRAAVAAEGQRLLEVMAPAAAERKVEFRTAA